MSTSVFCRKRGAEFLISLSKHLPSSTQLSVQPSQQNLTQSDSNQLFGIRALEAGQTGHIVQAATIPRQSSAMRFRRLSLNDSDPLRSLRSPERGMNTYMLRLDDREIRRSLEKSPKTGTGDKVPGLVTPQSQHSSATIQSGETCPRLSLYGLDGMTSTFKHEDTPLTTKKVVKARNIQEPDFDALQDVDRASATCPGCDWSLDDQDDSYALARLHPSWSLSWTESQKDDTQRLSATANVQRQRQSLADALPSTSTLPPRSVSSRASDSSSSRSSQESDTIPGRASKAPSNVSVSSPTPPHRPSQSRGRPKPSLLRRLSLPVFSFRLTTFRHRRRRSLPSPGYSIDDTLPLQKLTFPQSARSSRLLTLPTGEIHDGRYSRKSVVLKPSTLSWALSFASVDGTQDSVRAIESKTALRYSHDSAFDGYTTTVLAGQESRGVTVRRSDELLGQEYWGFGDVFGAV